MKPPESDRRGKHPIPVWIDGVKFNSSTEAVAELNLQGTTPRRRQYFAALEGSGRFEGHIVSHHPPEPPKKQEEPPKRRPGTPLLVEPCRHRLGYCPSRHE
jgi:hypothetical protein